MIIRLAHKEDFEELRSFYIIMNEVINKRTDFYDENNTYFPSDEMMLEAIEDQFQYVGIEDGKIVAAMIGNHNCDEAYKKAAWQVEASEKEFLVLHALRVLPEYGGRGYAKKMLRFLIDHAKESGQKAIRLDVLEGYEGPLKMYTGLGFQYIDTMEIFYEDIGKPVRFKLLEKVINGDVKIGLNDVTLDQWGR